MAGQFRISYDQARAASDGFDQGKAQIQDSIRDLESKMNSLTANWEGKAATDFQGLFADYGKGAKQMNEMLEQLSRGLRSFANAVQEFESKAFGQ